MKRRVVFEIIFLFALFLIISLNFVSAAITVTLPSNNTNWSTNAMFNVTYVNGTDVNWTSTLNASFYYTANISGSWTFLGNVTCPVATATFGYCNGTLSIANIEGNNFSINATINNGTTKYNASVITYNVTLDSRAPNVTYITLNKQNFSGLVIINISVADGRAIDSVFFNITNSNGTWLNFSRASTSGGGYYNYSFNTTGMAFLDGTYNITVFANDTQLGNLNNTEKVQIILDNTAPTGTLTCSPDSVQTGYTTTCTCSPSDTLSGIDSTSYSSSYTPSTSQVGTFITNCTFYDYARNLGSAVFSYTVTPLPTSQNPTSTGTTTHTDTFSSIVPGTTSIISNFDSSIGVQEIRINVVSEADNVQVKVIKYNDKPANVSVAKSGVYQYFQVQTQNLADKISNAMIEIRVNKTWFSQNSLTKNDVALFKYNEASSQWNELTTTYSSEDAINYYYNISMSSLSYFAIAQKEVNAQNQSSSENPNTSLSKDLTWLWITLIAVAGVAILVTLFLIIKKKGKRKR